VKRFDELVPGAWYQWFDPLTGHTLVTEYVGPLMSDYHCKNRCGYYIKFHKGCVVTGPVPKEEMTPIEREIDNWIAKGYPDDGEDSAPGYLRFHELVPGNSYTVYSMHSFLNDKVMKYLGKAEEETVQLPSHAVWYASANSMRSVFLDKDGHRHYIPSREIKPVSRQHHFYIKHHPDPSA